LRAAVVRAQSARAGCGGLARWQAGALHRRLQGPQVEYSKSLATQKSCPVIF